VLRQSTPGFSAMGSLHLLRPYNVQSIGVKHWPTQGGGVQAGPPPKVKYKKKRCSRYDDIKGFTSFTLQPKSGTEMD
jgi:hypothetical protein